MEQKNKLLLGYAVSGLGDQFYILAIPSNNILEKAQTTALKKIRYIR